MVPYSKRAFGYQVSNETDPNHGEFWFLEKTGKNHDAIFLKQFKTLHDGFCLIFWKIKSSNGWGQSHAKPDIQRSILSTYLKTTLTFWSIINCQAQPQSCKNIWIFLATWVLGSRYFLLSAVDSNKTIDKIIYTWIFFLQFHKFWQGKSGLTKYYHVQIRRDSLERRILLYSLNISTLKLSKKKCQKDVVKKNRINRVVMVVQVKVTYISELTFW